MTSDLLPVSFQDLGEGSKVMPIVLILDISGSMGFPEENPPIKNLNEALPQLAEYIMTDPEACRSCRICIVAAGNGAVINSPFFRVEDFDPPVFEAGGRTPLGQAMLAAIDLVVDFRRSQKEMGKDVYRPLIMTISDGLPTDDEDNPGAGILDRAAGRARKAAEEYKWDVVAVATQDADTEALFNFSTSQPVLRLTDDTDYTSLISFVSEVAKSVFFSSDDQPSDITSAVKKHEAIIVDPADTRGITIDTAVI